MGPGFSCIRCGYSLDDSIAERGAGCPECGVLAASSRESWSALGGESESLDRLLQSAAFAATIAIFLTAAYLGQALFSMAPFGSVAGSLLGAIDELLVVVGVASWWLWISTALAPPLRWQPRVSRIQVVLIVAWSLCAGFAALHALAPELFRRHDGVTVPMLFVVLGLFPIPLAMAVITQRAGSDFRAWRRRLMPGTFLAILLVVMALLYIGAICIEDPTLAGPTQEEGLRRLIRPLVMFLLMGTWWIGLPVVMGLLAISQLFAVRAAARALPDSEWYPQRVARARRCAWIGAVILPVVIFFGAVQAHATAAWFGGGTPGSLQRFSDFISDALADGWSLAQVIATVGGSALLWVIATLIPVLVARPRLMRTPAPGPTNT